MVRRYGKLSILSLAVLLGALLPLAATAAASQERALGEQLRLASRYAGYAAEATTVGAVHAHLQRAMNCLVGPQDSGYDPASQDPCEPLRRRQPLSYSRLGAGPGFQEALRYARSGLSMDSLPAARAAARATVRLIDGLAIASAPEDAIGESDSVAEEGFMRL